MTDKDLLTKKQNKIMVAINVVLVILGLVGGFFLSRYFSNKKLKELNGSLFFFKNEYLTLSDAFFKNRDKHTWLMEKYSELEVKYDELERDYNISHNISLDTISQLQKEKKEIVSKIEVNSVYISSRLLYNRYCSRLVLRT